MMRQRLLRVSFTTLALLGARTALAGPINFTGFVENDFVQGAENVRVTPVADSYSYIGQPSWMDSQGFVSGWAIKDVRTSYDQATDTLSVGINTFTNSRGQVAIVGDADGNGNPGGSAPETIKAGGVDYANLGGHESVAIGIAPSGPNNAVPTTALIVAGVPAIKTKADSGFPEFTVAKATGGALGYNFGQTLTDNVGAIAFNPSADHPGLEFTIKNFSKIPGINPFNGFYISAYAGSPDDVVVGEAGLRFTRVQAFAEQEIPEPATVVAWSAVLVGGAALRRRRRLASSNG